MTLNERIQQREAVEWLFANAPIPTQPVSTSCVPDCEPDWQQYFYRFMEAHGGSPIQLGDDVLLFRDGWRYSALNYEGPEYPPPTDPAQLAVLQRRYYQRRREIVSAELVRINNLIRQIEALDRSLPVPMKDASGTLHELENLQAAREHFTAEVQIYDDVLQSVE